VHKIPIQQGNVITQEVVNQLQPGMTKRQARYILGTPLLTDAFHRDRWDYVYTYQPGGGKREERHISLFFKDDALARLEGDIIAQPTDEPATPPTQEITVDVTGPQSEKKGLFGRLKDFLGLGRAE
jgi:Small protein A (tmRNA-binding)